MTNRYLQSGTALLLLASGGLLASAQSTAKLPADLDPALRSWIDSANRPQVDFPIQNLPYGVFRPKGTDAPWRVVLSNDKRRARLELIRVVLDGIDYADKDEAVVGKIDKAIVLDPGRYVSQAEGA